MINKGQVRSLVIFTSFVLVSIIMSLRISGGNRTSDRNLGVKTIDKTVFEGVQYYALREGNKSLYLTASLLEIFDKKLMVFEFPLGSVFTEDKEIKYKSDKGQFKMDKEILGLTGNVELTNTGGIYKSQKFTYYRKTNLIVAKDQVSSEMIDETTLDRINVRANKMELWTLDKKANFSGNVNGDVMRNRKYEEGMSFKSSELAADMANSLISLNGNVSINRSNYILTSRRGEIFLENYNKKLKYYALYDDIYLRESMTNDDGQVIERKAYAQKLEGHMATRKIILSGAPRVEQGNDVIKGYEITLREDADIVEVDDSQSRFEIKRDE